MVLQLDLMRSQEDINTEEYNNIKLLPRRCCNVTWWEARRTIETTEYNNITLLPKWCCRVTWWEVRRTLKLSWIIIISPCYCLSGAPTWSYEKKGTNTEEYINITLLPRWWCNVTWWDLRRTLILRSIIISPCYLGGAATWPDERPGGHWNWGGQKWAISAPDQPDCCLCCTHTRYVS